MKATSSSASRPGSSSRSVAGTVFSNTRPRLIQIKGIDMDAEFAPHMLYITNEDKPGFIGRLGTLLGDAGVNIANFNLGRSAPGADAIALLEVDEPVADARARPKSARSPWSSRCAPWCSEPSAHRPMGGARCGNKGKLRGIPENRSEWRMWR